MNKKITLFITILTITSLILTGCGKKNEAVQTDELAKLPQVSTLTLNKTSQIETMIRLTGTTKPATKVSLIALAPGTVVTSALEVGADVYKGTPIIFLYDQGTESNYNTAINNFNSAQRSLENTKLSATETINQSDLSVKNAEQSLELAKNNYERQITLAEESLNITLNGAIISAESALDTVFVSLLSVDDVLNKTLPDAELSAMNPNLKNKADINYDRTEEMYDQIKNKNITQVNISQILDEIINLVSETQNTVNLTMQILNNTAPSISFPLVSRQTVINTVYSRQGSLSTTKTALQTARQNIITTEINNQTTLETYKNYQDSAEIAYENSISGLSNTEQNTDTQSAGAEIAFERAQNELNLATIQKNRLAITSPLTGVISQLNVEVGDEVSPGQIIGEISQIDSIEIEVEVAPEIASVLTLGDEVKIDNDKTGLITVINPTADPSAGKVSVKITMLNNEQKLITESYAVVEIPISQKTSQENIFVIPLKAVYLSTDSAKAKVIIDGKTQTLTVTTGNTIGDLIEVITGFEENQMLIIGGADFLSDGTEVEIIK